MFGKDKMGKLALLSAGLFLVIALSWNGVFSCPQECDCSDEHMEMVVSCGGAGLNTIPKGIPPSTMWLVLKYNNLTKIGKNAFAETPQLRGVDLSNNNISEISPDAFTNLDHLDTVQLGGNSIQTIPEELFEGPIAAARDDGRRFFVFLNNNPWKCNCDIKWLRGEYEKYKKNTSIQHIYSERLVMCDSPPELKGQFVSEVPIAKFKCQAEIKLPTGLIGKKREDEWWKVYGNLDDGEMSWIILGIMVVLGITVIVVVNIIQMRRDQMSCHDVVDQMSSYDVAEAEKKLCVKGGSKNESIPDDENESDTSFDDPPWYVRDEMVLQELNEWRCKRKWKEEMEAQKKKAENVFVEAETTV